MMSKTQSSTIDTLKEVDAILLSVEQMIVASHSHSPFNSFLTQLPAEQAKAVQDGINELRGIMLCLAHHEGFQTDGPTINTTFAVRQSLEMTAVKLAEIQRRLSLEGTEPRVPGIDSEQKLLGQMDAVLTRMNKTLV